MGVINPLGAVWVRGNSACYFLHSLWILDIEPNNDLSRRSPEVRIFWFSINMELERSVRNNIGRLEDSNVCGYPLLIYWRE